MFLRRWGSSGTTFVEVSIAMLLVAIMSGAVFSVALTARRGTGRSFRKLVADQAARQFSERLKGYVTADYLNVNDVIAAASGGLGFKGPGAANTLSTWSMDDSATGTDDDCGCIGCSNPGCYALARGTHVVSGAMPLWFAGQPFNAKLRYVVSNMFMISGTTVPQVEVYVDWTEPQVR